LPGPGCRVAQGYDFVGDAYDAGASPATPPVPDSDPMERALADGIDGLNMSIGSSRAWPPYPTAAASTRLVNKGVSVVASAGNDGTIGLYADSAPSVGTKVISVAAFENTHVRLPFFTVSPDDRHIGYTVAA
jgi:minor extracellular serine protease Vpr